MVCPARPHRDNATHAQQPSSDWWIVANGKCQSAALISLSHYIRERNCVDSIVWPRPKVPRYKVSGCSLASNESSEHELQPRLLRGAARAAAASSCAQPAAHGLPPKRSTKSCDRRASGRPRRGGASTTTTRRQPLGEERAGGTSDAPPLLSERRVQRARSWSRQPRPRPRRRRRSREPAGRRGGAACRYPCARVRGADSVGWVVASRSHVPCMCGFPTHIRGPSHTSDGRHTNQSDHSLHFFGNA